MNDFEFVIETFHLRDREGSSGGEFIDRAVALRKNTIWAKQAADLLWHTYW